MTAPFKTIEELQVDIAADPALIVEWTSRALSDLDNHGRRLNAVVHIARDDAMARAEGLRDAALRDDVDRSSPLFGIPVAHKELYLRAGWPCEGGSRTLAGHHASRTSFAVNRLDLEGAVDCGRLTSAEFAGRMTGTAVDRQTVVHN